MNPERILSSDEVDSYASQAARFQDVLEDLGFAIEGVFAMPRQLRGALGPINARIVTERMAQIRRIPEERAIAEEAERRILTPPTNT